ncbi:hypothetical protein HDE_11741 [Halotydeus destructor]|nr:hypothetical protein HDE_11741 [Halotydeus destructor]
MQKCGGLRPPRPISIHSASSDSNVTNGSSTGPPVGRHAGDRKLQGHVGHHHQRPGKVASFQSALQFPKFDKASVGHKTIRPPGSGHATSGLPAPGSATAGGFGGVSNNGSTPYSAHSEPGGHCELPLPSVDNGRRSSSGSSNLSTNVAAGIAVMRRNGGGGIPAPRTRPTSVRVESITSPAPLTPSSGVVNGNPYHRDNNNGPSNGHQSSLSANNGTKGTPLSALASPPATLAGYRSKSPPASGVPRPMRGNFSSNGPSNPLMSSKSRQATKSTDSLLIEEASNNVSNGNCNVARVSPIRRQLADH